MEIIKTIHQNVRESLGNAVALELVIANDNMHTYVIAMEVKGSSDRKACATGMVT
jgi:hypothetical protein